MSMLLMVKAMQTKVGNPLRKLVLIKLADNANDLGECWPSYQHIADQCEISRSSVKNHIRELEKSGFVTRVFRKNGALNQSNIFRLNISQSSGAGNTPVGQELPEGGAGTDLGGGAGAAPRTSHSFEPVNEPIKNNDAEAPISLRPKSQKIPFQKIADLFNSILPELPAVVLINKSRESAIRSRWNDHPAHQSLEFWEDLFNDVRKSDFLMGRVISERAFRCSFDWIIKPSNFVKVVEGNYIG